MKRGLELSVLLIMLALGGALRVSYLDELSRTPEFDQPAVDAGYHDYWARALATGDWSLRHVTYDPEIRQRPYFRPPGYPYFLAAVYRWIGDDYRTPRAVQMLVGLATALLLYRLGRQLFGAAAGLAAALLLSTYWVLIHFEGEFLDAALLLFMTVAFLHVLCRMAFSPRWWLALAAGLLGGGTALVRPTILTFLPVALGWAVWQAKKAGSTRHALQAAVAFACGLVLTIAPVTLRNLRVGGEWVLISANSGINLLIGNNPKADGTIGNPHIDPGLPFMNSDDYPVGLKALERQWGRPSGYAELSAYFSRQAWQYIREHPARTLQLMWRKTLLFWGPAELGHQKELHYDREHSPLLARLPVSFPALLALALAGLSLWMVQQRDGHKRNPSALNPARDAVLLLLGFVFVTYASLLPFFMTAQYRLPVIPVLALLGGYGLQELPRLVRADRRRLLIGLVVLSGSYAVLHVNWAGLQPEPERWYFTRARALEKRNQTEAAADAYRKAVALNPRYHDALINLGILCARQQKLDEAEQLFLRAAAVEPSAPAQTNLGRLYKLRGQREKARLAYETALQINPLYEVALNNLGVLLIEEGRWMEAERHFRTALELRSEWPDPLINLADVLRRQGRFDESESCYNHLQQKFPALAPRLAPARKRLQADRAAAR